MSRCRWTKQDDADLRRLVRSGELTFGEIAPLIGRKKNAVVSRAQRLGLKNPTYRRRITKHKHLRRRAMVYYLTHTAAETEEHFGLTPSEFKSLLTVSYRDPKYDHLRKDTRRHDAWSFAEIMFLLRHAGLQGRCWIAGKLKRGGVHAVKEAASRLGANTRYINGLPRCLAEELVGRPIEGFKVKAGPTAPGVDGRPIIVPWVVLYSEAKRSGQVPAHLVAALRAMSRFQKRIHGTRGINDTVASVIKSIGRK